jgi:hypothetical protein
MAFSLQLFNMHELMLVRMVIAKYKVFCIGCKSLKNKSTQKIIESETTIILQYSDN